MDVNKNQETNNDKKLKKKRKIKKQRFTYLNRQPLKHSYVYTITATRRSFYPYKFMNLMNKNS